VCTVIVGWKVLPDAPVILAANRDELLARPTDPPMLLSEHPPRWGGRDRLAGGTWLAIDPAGRLGAVTNRHPGGRPPARDASRSSRGALPLELLADGDPPEAAWLESLDSRDFNPVNLLYASPDAVVAVSLDDDTGRRIARPGAGVHVLTEQDVDDPRDAKTEAIRRRAEGAVAGATNASELVAAWREILRSHDADYQGSPACIHGDIHGTVSSSTVIIFGDGRVSYEHAEGPPCVTPFHPVL
jgi:uncharacterized protein with NRDE domain